MTLDGKTVIVTGAGRGIGRAHAIHFADAGARVVVNDVGVDDDGRSTAAGVVAEIEARGGSAVAHTESVSNWRSAEELIAMAVEAFGGLDALVNNAGLLRDRMLVNMTEQEWDQVVEVNLRGTFCPTRHAAAYWRDEAKRRGAPVGAAIVCTSSASGLQHQIGQANYGAAKAGVAAFGLIAARDLERYGVRVNVITPGARTSMTTNTPGLGEQMAAPEDADLFDVWAPDNISPLVGYLASDDCPYTGGVWFVAGGRIGLYESWEIVAEATAPRGWTHAHLADAVPGLVGERADRVNRLLSESSAQTAMESVSDMLAHG